VRSRQLTGEWLRRSWVDKKGVDQLPDKVNERPKTGLFAGGSLDESRPFDLAIEAAGAGKTKRMRALRYRV
jgi:hypothetical protein